jgi:predicted RNase H-like HicB family nuclease
MKIKIEKNDDGFLARLPDVQGAFAEGDTAFEALCNLFDVIKMILEYRQFPIIKSSKNIEFNIPIAI